MKALCASATTLLLVAAPALGQAPSRQETVTPIRQKTFDREGEARGRRQGGNPREVNGLLVFDGSMDGNRQVDPQIAVGVVLHGTNSGLVIYDKQGTFVDGVSQNVFNGGIDPKLFFDPHSRVFGFDLWNPWDEEKLKPVNISVSATSDPTGARGTPTRFRPPTGWTAVASGTAASGSAIRSPEAPIAPSSCAPPRRARVCLRRCFISPEPWAIPF